MLMGDATRIVGKTFGCLEVLEFIPRKPNKRRGTYSCRCTICGNYCERYYVSIINKPSYCHNCNGYKISEKHGDTGTRFYTIWKDIRHRTNRKWKNEYPAYTNISVCDRWHNSYLAFKEDMYDSYLAHVKEFGEDNTSIDRIDVLGDYTVENCRWADKEIQNNNKTTSRKITYNNETRTVTQWAKNLGVNARTLSARIFDYGWSVERSFTEPVHEHIKEK